MVPSWSEVYTRASARERSAVGTHRAVSVWIAGIVTPSAAPIAARHARRAVMDAVAAAGVSMVNRDQRATPAASAPVVDARAQR